MICLIHKIYDKLLDVNLDGIVSYPVADALDSRGVPFAFITGYGSRGLRKDYLLRPTLKKPFRRQALDQMLKGLLSGQAI